jgi:hypothetical protein
MLKPQHELAAIATLPSEAGAAARNELVRRDEIANRYHGPQAHENLMARARAAKEFGGGH